MATQVVTFCTYREASCNVGLPAEVILCVPSSVTVDESTFINGTLTSSTKNATCGSYIYKYTIEYDDAQLLTPSTPLTSGEVSGIICRDCLINWIDSRLLSDVRVIDQNLTAVGTEGAVETDLISFTLPANTLDVNNDSLLIRFSGTTSDLDTLRFFKVYVDELTLGDCFIDTGISAPIWDATVEIVRRSLNGAYAHGNLNGADANEGLIQGSNNSLPNGFGSDISIRITGQAIGAGGDNVITKNCVTVLKQPFNFGVI